MKKTISILGSTGSIGLSTLSIVDKKKNYFKIHLLSAKKNYKIAYKQILKYSPIFFIITDPVIYKKLKSKIKSKKTVILNSFKHVNFKKKNDITISAIPGIAGLEPTLKLIKSSKKMLIANKESIICGWDLIKHSAKVNKSKIIPIDSEHFSIFKLIENHDLKEIKKVYLTASGGPFLNYKLSKLKKVTPKEALKHPKWKMGKKISIDSATLMNKIFELVEAQKIFNLPNNKLDILIHPDSLVHAIVEFKGGLIKFIYHETSMIIPLANAIFEGDLDIENFYKTKKSNLNSKIQNLNFKKVDERIFPIVKLKKRINEHYSTPIIINAANEILVDQFLQKKIPFFSIFKFIMNTLNDRNYKKYAIRRPKKINDIYLIDNWARTTTLEKIKFNNE
jgi:1-deoxy-D-xylulose-5-phosphate reductoisomerase